MNWQCTIFLMLITMLGNAAQIGTPSETNLPITPPPPHSSAPLQSYMMISPSARALDFLQAFEQMRKEKSTGKVYFELADGSTINNIIEMTLMSNSTLALFRFNSSQGIRFQVVRVEDLLNIRY